MCNNFFCVFHLTSIQIVQKKILLERLSSSEYHAFNFYKFIASTEMSMGTCQPDGDL